MLYGDFFVTIDGTTKTSKLGYLRRDLREHPQSHRSVIGADPTKLTLLVQIDAHLTATL